MRAALSTGVAPPTVRPATPADTPDVARLWRAAWIERYRGRVPAELVAARGPAHFAARAARMVAATTVATDADSELLGLIVVAADELVDLALDPARPRPGVAAALLSAAEAAIAVRTRWAWSGVVAGDVRTRALLERSGWVDAGEEPYRASAAAGTIAVPVHRYVKDLRL